METMEAILELRKKLNISQDEFARRLSVTRQAVSRWENGDTIPNIDTLKLIAETFEVSVDYLLGHTVGQCQSCGLVLEKDSDKGTECDGSKSEEYCSFCYQHGKFAQDITMEEMIELNLRDLDEWNKSVGLQLTEQEATRKTIQRLYENARMAGGKDVEFLPTLKRWKDTSGTAIASE